MLEAAIKTWSKQGLPCILYVHWCHCLPSFDTFYHIIVSIERQVRYNFDQIIKFKINHSDLKLVKFWRGKEIIISEMIVIAKFDLEKEN